MSAAKQQNKIFKDDMRSAISASSCDDGEERHQCMTLHENSGKQQAGDSRTRI